MKRKVVATILSLTLAMTMLAGCGNKQEAPAEQPAETEQDAPEADDAEPAEGEEPAASTGEAEIVLKYAELNPDGHIMDECADYFAEQVAEMSNGRIEIDVFPAGQLGDEKTAYQTIQMGGGAIDICRGNTNSLADFGAEKLNLFGLPFVFQGREHLWNVLESEIGADFLAEPQEKGMGMVGLFYLDEGSRNFFTIESKPIESVEDFKGLKLRVPTTLIMEGTTTALGASATPISFSELYSSLQTGVVDGAEQPHSGYFSNKFYEVAPNYTLTGHTYSPSIILMSESVWNNLSAEDQQILLDAAKATEQYNKETITELDGQLLEDIKAAGANVIEITDNTPFVEATADVTAEYTKTEELKSLYDQILSMK